MERKPAKPAALAGVFVGAAGFAASLTAVYLGMRDVMINSGGYCASGGPYQIAPGHECQPGSVWLLIGGIFAMLLFGAVLLGCTGLWGDGSIAGVGLLMWAGLFGALGFNFIQLAIDPPAQMSGSGTVGWWISGIVFWLMALGGLIPGLMALAGAFREEKDPVANATFKAPLVRANVSFERSMPGDPAFGMTDPAAAAAAGQAPPPKQAPPAQASTAGDFVDPVTGEHIKDGDDS